ncbi:YbaB/EbfC DNA-binding family protein [Actinokineospora alba]|uniref:YbaB/EbfC DNA-binding family protein n=1 Tax=Actinokineospora alba TaxID=504798 RepID=A0A1H0VI44_9PSEU|nr:YbaB/EbfC family nucleoid-associated protein [Actinokineospora alba]TDP67699.1 YbaB/EbfC DNA-binding family protein [Actinokineospora alba]SDJ27995.1 YbaB/EbfC DNA-binding family protein [Actinokineospora alba]SDP78222.1 YbaB/EbfC DNA-binding family protein [Actinokineospora alba]
MTNTDPNLVLSDYEKRVAALLEKAEEAKTQIRDLTGSATSQDGAVTVTVSAAGALVDLSFGAEAEGMPRARLAALVMATARRAQAQATQRITEIMAPIIGDNTDAMRFLHEQVPPVVVPDEPPPAAPVLRQFNEEEAAEQPPQAPIRQPRPARATDEDENDYDQGDPLSRGDK